MIEDIKKQKEKENRNKFFNFVFNKESTMPRRNKRKGNGIQRGGNLWDDIRSGAKVADKWLRDNKVISKLADVVDWVPGVNIPGTDVGLAGAIRATTKITGYGKKKKMRGRGYVGGRPLKLGGNSGYVDSQFGLPRGGPGVNKTAVYGTVSSEFGKARF